MGAKGKSSKSESAKQGGKVRKKASTPGKSTAGAAKSPKTNSKAKKPVGSRMKTQGKVSKKASVGKAKLKTHAPQPKRRTKPSAKAGKAKAANQASKPARSPRSVKKSIGKAPRRERKKLPRAMTPESMHSKLKFLHARAISSCFKGSSGAGDLVHRRVLEFSITPGHDRAIRLQCCESVGIADHGNHPVSQRRSHRARVAAAMRQPPRHDTAPIRP